MMKSLLLVFFFGAISLCECSTVNVGLNSNKPFTLKIEKDTWKFLTDVRKWTNKIIRKHTDENEIPVAIAPKFTFLHENLVNKEKKCGDLVLHKMFAVVSSFVDHPQLANFTVNRARGLMWRPSFDCLRQHEFQKIDGGAHVELSFLCGEQQLFHAKSFGGGAWKKQNSWWESAFIGGSGVSVSILNGQILIEGGITGTWKAAITKSKVPKNSYNVVKTLKQTIAKCAQNHTLTVKSQGGGGWNENYTQKVSHMEVVDKLGYAFAFELGYVVKEKSTMKSKKAISSTTTPTPISSGGKTIESPTPFSSVVSEGSNSEDDDILTKKDHVFNSIAPTLSPQSIKPHSSIAASIQSDDDGDELDLLSKEQALSIKNDAVVSKLIAKTKNIASAYYSAARQCYKANNHVVVCVAEKAFTTLQKVNTMSKSNFSVNFELLEKPEATSNAVHGVGIVNVAIIAVVAVIGSVMAVIMRTFRRRQGYDRIPRNEL